MIHNNLTDIAYYPNYFWSVENRLGNQVKFYVAFTTDILGNNKFDIFLTFNKDKTC